LNLIKIGFSAKAAEWTKNIPPTKIKVTNKDNKHIFFLTMMNSLL